MAEVSKLPANICGISNFTHIDNFPPFCYFLQEEIIMEHITTIRPDAKGRVNLGKLAQGISSFRITNDGEKIILEPYVEIPAREKWLFDNPEVLAQVKTGLAQVGAGKAKSLGSFTQYADEENE